MAIKRFFFFQAEDGIRDTSVTGVQTCALPISSTSPPSPNAPPASTSKGGLQPGSSISPTGSTFPYLIWYSILGKSAVFLRLRQLFCHFFHFQRRKFWSSPCFHSLTFYLQKYWENTPITTFKINTSISVDSETS